MSYGFSRKLALTLVESKVKAYIGIGNPNKKANSSSHRQKTYKEGYVPSVNVFRADGNGSSGIHTPDDHPKYISNSGLGNTIKATLNIVERIVNAKISKIK